jgi:carbon-monoxide dehydrogenase medium subunit
MNALQAVPLDTGLCYNPAMRAFDYTRAATIEEAAGLLHQAEGRARILSGGTDLIVGLRERRLTADLIIDVKAIDELKRMDFDSGTGLHIGAAVPCWRIYGDFQIATAYPGLIDAVQLIGGVQIQGRASLGGNLCNASPAADSIPALIAHAAQAEIAGPAGRRTIAVENFCVAPGRTVLAPDELLVSLHLPPPQPHYGAAYTRFIPRNEMDIAVAGAAAAVSLDEHGSRFVGCRVALAAVAPTPLVVPEIEQLLGGQRVDDAAVAKAAAAAQAAAQPISDMRGTAEYRRQLVGVLVKRALETAIMRARQGVT